MKDLAEKQGISFLSVIPIRKEASDASEMISQILFGETYDVLDEKEKWLKIKMHLDGYEGFIDKKQFQKFDWDTVQEFNKDDTRLVSDNVKIKIDDFGILALSPASEVPQSWLQGENQFLRRKGKSSDGIDQLLDDLQKFLGTPYLWGGRSISGIDCSGLMQVVFKLNGINIPRDAWQQEKYFDTKKEFKDRAAGDIVFFSNEKGKIIHVGLLANKDSVIHASGWVKENDFTSEGIVDEMGKLSHKLHSIASTIY